MSAPLPRAVVIPADGGERRLQRGGTAPLLIKVDPANTGSRRLVLGSSDLPPGDAIAVLPELHDPVDFFIASAPVRAMC